MKWLKGVKAQGRNGLKNKLRIRYTNKHLCRWAVEPLSY